MRDPTGFSLVKWPFLLADALLLTAAYLIYRQSASPMGWWEVSLVVLCVAGGAGASITPFLLEYRVAARMAEARELSSTANQLWKLESVAGQRTAATGQPLTLQHEAGEAPAPKGNAEGMELEAEPRTERTQLANDREGSKPKLGAGMPGQADGDWLQVLVQLLDHVYALHLGALRSGQPLLIEQISQFQDACRDAARRIGLTPFIAEPAEAFDAQRHRWVDGDGAVPAQAVVGETIAAGYKFKGNLLRPALVRLLKSDSTQSAESPTGTEPSQLAPGESGSPATSLGVVPDGP